MKRVRITIEVDEHFVRLLRANLTLKNRLNIDEQPKMTATDVLGIVVMGEARGALEEQIHAMTPQEWRPHIEAIHSMREVRP